MERAEVAQYWMNTAEQDYVAMQHLFQTKDYVWCLFIGHLVIEKLLKAVYSFKNQDTPPKTHDLLRLADKSGILLSDIHKDFLDLVTTFNISARYPDYKMSFYQLCNDKFATDSVRKIEELRTWLLTMLKKELLNL